LVAAPDLLSADELRALGASLIGPEVVYFPVRHHSPACGLHLRDLIRARRPATILIEGPTGFDGFVDLLAHEETRPPVAIYSYCSERSGGDAAGFEKSRRRRGAYYPFCDYSPEWIAVREGRGIGATIRFIDLDFPQQLRVDRTERLSGRLATLLGERYFQRSAHLRRLAADRGCRDQDELWDRLFEAWAAHISVDTFVAQVAAYCRLSRLDVGDAEHAQDGTTAREAEMAWHVRRALDERAAGDGPLLVVTGGYHSVALPELVAAGGARPRIDTGGLTDAGSVLIRYSFDRLDRVNGYAAGMPQPAYYQRAWEAVDGQARDVALELIAETAMRARELELDQAPSTAAVIAASEQVRRLASLRGNPQPLRTDVLDAIASCFAKGAIDAEGQVILSVALRLMSGDAVGSVPRAAGMPAIVADFHAVARSLRLRIASTETRQLALDVYRDAADRRVSQFLHVLTFLDVPFATRLAGPQLTAGHVGKRLQEAWQYGWSPLTESSLVDAAVWGSSLREAAASRFLEELDELDQEGGNRSAEVASTVLSRACLYGLHELTDRILRWLRACVREDPSIVSLSSGLTHLTLLWESRDPLGAEGLQAVPELARGCMERACYLMHELHRTASADAPRAVDALIELRHALAGAEQDWFDAELYWTSLEPIASRQPCEPMLAGAAAGLLYAGGRWAEEQLAAALAGHVAGRGRAKAAAAYLGGLAAAAREALWQSSAILRVLREIIEDSSHEEFLALLPELRLSFARLTPRETDAMGEIVARALGASSFGPIVEHDLGEVEVARNLHLSQQIDAVLRRDGLDDWVGAAGEPAAPSPERA
jgi:hypothetical protein